jgi:membrane protein implicated in regulation of membrane protease activity
MLPTREDLETIGKMFGIVVLTPTLIVVGTIALVSGWTFGFTMMVFALASVSIVVLLFLYGFVQGVVEGTREQIRANREKP